MKRIKYRYSHWNDGTHKFTAREIEMSDEEFAEMTEEDLEREALDAVMECLEYWYDVDGAS